MHKFFTLFLLAISILACIYFPFDWVKDRGVMDRQVQYKHTVDSIYLVQKKEIEKLSHIIDSLAPLSNLEADLNKAENEIEELDIKLYHTKKRLDKLESKH